MDIFVKGNLEMEGVSIVLRKWTPIFYARQARVDKELIWVKLPRLPYHLWNPIIFRMIMDALGLYVDVDMSYKVTRDMMVSKIQVMLDVREGLTGIYVLIWWWWT